MLKPVNGHLLIEPIKHEGFMATQKDTYEEIGVVVDVSDDLKNRFQGLGKDGVDLIVAGTKVYFDSWLAAKYLKEGKDDEFYWLVNWSDVRAVEAIPE